MTRISKTPIPEKTYIRMYELFFKVISRSNDKDSFSSVISEILSSTEKVMIAKRIAIIYLLIKSLDISSIAELLKVSQSTVAYYRLLTKNPESRLYKTVKNIINEEKAVGFIEDIFAGIFIQPGVKIGHYKRQLEYQKMKEERKGLG